MLLFHEVGLDLKSRYDERLKLLRSRTTDQCFGYLYCMQQFYGLRWAESGNFFLIRGMEGGVPFYGCPIGDLYGDPQGAGEALRALFSHHAHTHPGTGLRFLYITEEQANAVAALFPGLCTVERLDRGSDYLYEAESLRTYPGKPLHGKRNHLNRFLKSYRHEVVPIDESTLPECLSFAREWYDLNREYRTDSLKMEYRTTITMLENFEALGLLGILLRVEGRPEGFSFGEASYPGSDTVLVHGEKANYEFSGIYPALSAFFNQAFPQFEYVNREDDAGDEGLRKSKESYRPLKMLYKYQVLFSPESDVWR